MNFTDTMASVELVLAANQVPLLVGETGIGKTSLAARVAAVHDWELVTIDGNLLKEGEIGGLPTVETVSHKDSDGTVKEIKTTVYAVHHTLEHVSRAINAGRHVLLFIDEINRAEHAVQQELMNLILNREINGFILSDDVRIIAAMNPEDSFDRRLIWTRHNKTVSYGFIWKRIICSGLIGLFPQTLKIRSWNLSPLIQII